MFNTKDYHLSIFQLTIVVSFILNHDWCYCHMCQRENDTILVSIMHKRLTPSTGVLVTLLILQCGALNRVCSCLDLCGSPALTPATIFELVYESLFKCLTTWA